MGPIVTGAARFIGSTLVARLLADGVLDCRQFEARITQIHSEFCLSTPGVPNAEFL
jgi:nucleoside-diphosphate-sugar epimerase